MSFFASGCFCDSPEKQEGRGTDRIPFYSRRILSFQFGALAAILIAGVPADAVAAIVASWTNSSLNASQNVINASVGQANIRRGSNVSRVSDSNHFSTTGWSSSEQSPPGFNNRYIEIQFASQGHTGLYFVFTHSKSSSSGPDYAKVYAETSPGVFTQVGNRFTLSTSESNVTLALPAALENKTISSPARLRIHVYGDAAVEQVLQAE